MKITATYRLQLHAGFTFDDARALVPYLRDLGISHVYASPYVAAEPGSTHGYNLVDPSKLNPEIGDETAYLAWTEALASASMGHIVDFVPNHMGATQNNPWWNDVLENGPSSLHADSFDIEWAPPKAALANKVLLAVLGGQYGEVLERGELVAVRDGGAFYVTYWDRRLPLSPPTMAPLLERAGKALDRPATDPVRQELESVIVGLRNMPPSTATTTELRAERAREKEILKRRLAVVCAEEDVARSIDRELAALNGKAGDRRSFDALDALLLEQSWRLAFWRVATEEINYRRFFDVNDLAAVRMETDAVFDAAHALILRYVREGRIQGVRLDHTDGLFDPAAYFEKLGEKAERDLYVVAEKILAQTEELPRAWKIDGTTGYDFLVQVSGLFVDARAEEALTRTYQSFTGDRRRFADHAHEAKRAIMRSSLSSEIHMLGVLLERIATRDRRSRDFTLHTLRRAVSETIAAFSVYRTYLRPDGGREPSDESIIFGAVRTARRRNPEISPSVFEFLRDVLLFVEREPDPASEPEDRAARVHFAMRFQQLTGPVTAKGVEDTAFYTYVRFVALNEVGGNPGIFGTSIDAFHRSNAARNEHWPRAMTATGTHDTKRGEDVRARLAVLSEVPEWWADAVAEWDRMTAAFVREIDEEPAPSRGDRYLFFQTVLGACPLEDGAASAIDASFAERVSAYMIKAAREGKQRTSWLSPDEGYEDALRSFVMAALGDDAFAASLLEKSNVLATYGASNGLSMALLEIASPGIPDRYQGSELWDFRLVDPDNRAPVDYEKRRRMLEPASAPASRGHESRRLEPASAPASRGHESRRLEPKAEPRELLASFRDGRVKLHVIREASRLRRERPDVFVGGSYEPLEAGEMLVGFVRAGEVIALATRQPWRATKGLSPWAIGDAWGEQTIDLPTGTFRDVLTGRTTSGGRVRVGTLLDTLPVGLWVRV